MRHSPVITVTVGDCGLKKWRSVPNVLRPTVRGGSLSGVLATPTPRCCSRMQHYHASQHYFSHDFPKHQTFTAFLIKEVLGEVILPNRVFGWEKNEKGAEDLREAKRVRLEMEDRRRTTVRARQRDQQNKEETGEQERRRKRRRERPHNHAARTSHTTRVPQESFPVGSTCH